MTYAEVFREPREYGSRRSQICRTVAGRFFFLFTSEYCFSHYITLFLRAVTDFRLLFGGWRGLVVAFCSLAAVADVDMSVYNRLRVEIRNEKDEIEGYEKSDASRHNGDHGVHPANEGTGS